MKPQAEIALPDKASALLRLAVADARKVSKMKTRVLDMEVWHQPDGGKCAVCMAGAVMDRTLRADPKKLLVPGGDGMSDQNTAALLRINALRRGFDSKCIIPYGHDALDLIRAHYKASSGLAPWRIYLKAAAMLEKDGL